HVSEPNFIREPFKTGSAHHIVGVSPLIVDLLRDLFSQTRNRCGQLLRSSRRFAEPKRNRRRLTMRVEDADLAGPHALDFVRAVAKLKDVAGETLDREIVIQRSDQNL